MTDEDMDDMLEAIGNALKQWRRVAKSNGLKAKEIRQMEECLSDIMTAEIME